MVENWLAKVIALFTTLVIYACIVSISRVLADCDGNLFARPSTGSATFVVTRESTHDVCVILSNNVFGVIIAVKLEKNTVCL